MREEEDVFERVEKGRAILLVIRSSIIRDSMFLLVSRL